MTRFRRTLDQIVRTKNMAMYENRPNSAYVSAYGLARAQGFSGTLSEWLESLHGYVHIKYANYLPTSDRDMKDEPDNWIGFASTNSPKAPESYQAYKWSFIKGEAQARLICEEYSRTQTYKKGDYVAYAEEIWECKDGIIIPEEFTASHWMRVDALNRISERVHSAEEVAERAAEASSEAPNPDTFSKPVPITKGGTGATTAAGARTNLEITPETIGAKKLYAVERVEHGGTGASSAAGARANLGITPANIGAVPTSSYETWTFTKKDGTTITRKVYIQP